MAFLRVKGINKPVDPPDDWNEREYYCIASFSYGLGQRVGAKCIT